MDIEEYEREGRATYSAFAGTIASILTAAICAEAGYRLQQVKERAKDPASLRRKLGQREIATTKTLENDIKDLAGCRAIFYTNGDVTRFINSGIIEQNFEVLEIKLHHPRREAEDATELYISNHYLVRLRPERTALPEYARFANMRCEIQIQTILNHAWAEMAHDTIYKAPVLDDFGSKAFIAIKSRMKKVARKYLLPAGHEFQKIASDFQRLIEGKSLFDGDALEAIVDAVDNNVRAEALETFSESVLPLYDDLQEVYPEVVDRLIAAAGRARTTPPAVIETPYGSLPAKTYSDIVEGIGEILMRYRYLDIEATFDALCTLFRWAGSEDERKPLLKICKALAKYELQVWRQCGPRVQAVLIEHIEAQGDEERRELEPLLTSMLGEILGAEIRGTTSSSTAVTFRQGAVISSEALRFIRTKAIELLKYQFGLATNEKERRAVLMALQSATRPPISTEYSNEVARLVMEDTHKVLEFQVEIAPTLSFELRQTVEERVHHCYWMYAALPAHMRDIPDLIAGRALVETSAVKFRDVANADPDFEAYKVLVGFNSIFPPAWEDKDFRYEQTEAYRVQRVEALLATIDVSSADAWFDRISLCARTESDDLATFPVFVKFLERMAEVQPAIVLGYLDRLEGPLLNFLPSLTVGLMRSVERTQTLIKIETWLREGMHIGSIAWCLRFADPFDEALLRQVLYSAIEHGDGLAVRNALIAATSQFEANPGSLIEEVFLPALRYLKAANDFSWVRMRWLSWLKSPILHALDLEQASELLDVLVPYPELEYNAEQIVAAIAERWPARVIAFLGERQAYGRTNAPPPRYYAVPFHVHYLQTPLATVPDVVLEGARTWFDADTGRFSYNGGMFLASVFPGLSNGLEARLAALVTGGGERDLAFVLGVLSAFEGDPCVYGLVRSIVAALRPENPLLREARSVLHKSGVVSGVFGSADLHTQRKGLLEGWLSDPNETVKTFAKEQIRELDILIASEVRSAEASIALRRLDYDEELDGGVEE